MSAGPSSSRTAPATGSRRAWPEPAQFNEAVQNLASSTADRELQGGEPELNALGLPSPYAGAFADVYKVHCPATGTTWAVKFFKREVRNLRERYRAISDHLIASQLPFMVDFRYLEEGVRINGVWYPLVKMRWIEGQSLNRFVAQSVNQPKMLDQLFQLWVKVAARLRAAGIAHADLQHGNVVLVPQGDQGRLLLKLIDYDGMFVPALAGQQSGELGHAHFQHPQRERTKAYNAELDRFSHLAICCALRCLAVGGLPLWERFNNHENLLFTAQDYADPANSKLFRELWTLRHPDAHALVGRLALATQQPLEQAPLIEELVQDNRVRPLTPEEQQAAQSLLLGSAPAPVEIRQPVTAPSAAIVGASRSEPASAPAIVTAQVIPGAQPESPTTAARTAGFSPLTGLVWLVRAVDGLLARCAGQDNALLHNYFRLIFLVVLLVGVPLGSRFVYGFVQQRWEQARLAWEAEARQAAQLELEQVINAWTSALEQVDEPLLTRHAANTFQAAAEAAQEAGGANKSHDVATATAGFRKARELLSQAEAETVAALATELETALTKPDTELALQHLATIKKLRPNDSRLSAWENELVSLTGGPLPSADLVLPQGLWVNSVGMELQPIRAGEFLMGSPDDGNSDADERPQHRVRISHDFYLGKCEVTQAQYKTITGKDPSKFKGSDLPVEQVSARDAEEFCRLLTEADRAAGKLPEGMVYRLPTEAQWEYAARAGTTTAWYFGDNEQEFPKYGWCDKNSFSRSHTVAQHQPNAWGLYDMAGNVEEWVADVHRANSYGERKDRLTVDPLEDADEFSRVVRGGGWNNSTQACRSAFRNSTGASNWHPSLGFRVALVWQNPNSITARPPVAIPTFTLPKEIKLGSQGLPDTVTSTIGMKLKRIKAGSFKMGSAIANEWATPQHEVQIADDFYLGIYEVTQAEYRAVMGINPSFSKGDDSPVEQVTSLDADSFCKLLTDKDLAAGRLPKGMVYRLPTEAQWEYAARAGTTTAFFYGDSASILGNFGWYSENSLLKGALAVGQKKPNPWGLYDIAGNVAEWTLDEFEDLDDFRGAYRRRMEGKTEPVKNNPVYRVARGGSWAALPAECQSDSRGMYLRATPVSQCGFRVALVKEVGAAATSSSSSAAPGPTGRSAPPDSAFGGAVRTPFPKLPAGAGSIARTAPKALIPTGSGLKYRVLRAGTGAFPTPTSTVTVHYHGWLDNGKVFQSTYGTGAPIPVSLGTVIRGWTEGLQLVGKGGMIELEVPPELGYGGSGGGADIPPQATLHFVVELLDVK